MAFVLKLSHLLILGALAIGGYYLLHKKKKQVVTQQMPSLQGITSSTPMNLGPVVYVPPTSAPEQKVSRPTMELSWWNEQEWLQDAGNNPNIFAYLQEPTVH